MTLVEIPLSASMVLTSWTNSMQSKEGGDVQGDTRYEGACLVESVAKNDETERWIHSD